MMTPPALALGRMRQATTGSAARTFSGPLVPTRLAERLASTLPGGRRGACSGGAVRRRQHQQLGAAEAADEQLAVQPDDVTQVALDVLAPALGHRVGGQAHQLAAGAGDEQLAVPLGHPARRRADRTPIDDRACLQIHLHDRARPAQHRDHPEPGLEHAARFIPGHQRDGGQPGLGVHVGDVQLIPVGVAGERRPAIGRDQQGPATDRRRRYLGGHRWTSQRRGESRPAAEAAGRA